MIEKSVTMRTWAGVLVGALVPVVLMTAFGGADLCFGPLRLSFWGFPGPMIALAGAITVHVSASWIGRNKIARFGSWFALICFSWVALRMWTGGDHFSRMVLFAQIGWTSLLLSFLSLWRHFRHELRPSWKALAASLAVGGILFAAVVHLDRNTLKDRINSSAAINGGGDVILLVIDALRADALGLYGATPSPSSFLDELASTGVVFDRAYSQAPWTVPSVASLMSSLYPTTVRPPNGGDPWKIENGNLVQPLPEEMPWLATRFRESGYHTVGLVKNEWLGGPSGFDRDFDIFQNVGGEAADRHSARQLVDAVRKWSRIFVEEREKEQVGSFFLYLHFMDPHIPYRPPRRYFPPEAHAYNGPQDGTAGSLRRSLKSGVAPTMADREHLKSLYRGEVAYLDSQLRRLHQILFEAGLWTADTTVVVVADHGEQFGEHGGFQHGDIFRENVHVPMMILGPNLAPSRISLPVRLIDVAPTVLDLVGLDGFGFTEGRSLVPALEGQRLPTIPVLTEHGRNRRVTGAGHSLLVHGRTTTVFAVEDRAEEYRLDAGEVLEGQELLAWLSDHDERDVPGFSEVAPVELETEALEKLRQLGYLE